MGMAASGLALIALKSAEFSKIVTQELVKLLSSDREEVRQRASEALRDMAAGENTGSSKNRTGGGGGGGGGAKGVKGLVNLLRDGLKTDNVEAQEYALWSLSKEGDSTSRLAMVECGMIAPTIDALASGKLSAVAQEHAAVVLSGLAPMGDNAIAIKEAGGIEPLARLLREGQFDAKEHAAVTCAQLARRAQSAYPIAEAGGVAAFVSWLRDPTIGPPEVAARALSEIALDNPDTQAQIAEEGAIGELITMISTWAAAAAAAAAGGVSVSSMALKLANVAAGCLATLAKDHIVNQIMITEEHGRQS